MRTPPTDVLIVGAGPAGLTAATYLARFRRSITLVDDGRSRAALIPMSRNCPGFARGVRGADLLAELRQQAANHGVHVLRATVSKIGRRSGGFSARIRGRVSRFRTVILASGIEDAVPPLHGMRAAIRSGRVALCPLCDAYETKDKVVGVWTDARRLVAHARYLRSFTRSVHGLLHGSDTLSPTDLRQLAREGVPWLRPDRVAVRQDGKLAFEVAGGTGVELDVVYPFWGSRPRTALATALGARCTADGSIRTTTDMQTSVPRLYAAGDVTDQINQIAVAMGHAARAATAIHAVLPHRRL